MMPVDLVLWSMVLGAIAAVAFARFVGFLTRPGVAQVQAVAFHATAFCFVLVQSGVGSELWAGLDGWRLHHAQVLAGPVCVGLSNYWIRGWLYAVQRDNVMSVVLRVSSLLSPLVGLACLALPLAQQLPAAAAASMVGASLALWLSVRAWLMGDRLAPVMSAGNLLTLAAVAGLHAVAMNLPVPRVAVMVIALCAAVGNGVCGFALWRRDRHEWKAALREAGASGFDPVTKLHSGASFVQRLVKAQRRRQRTGRDGAVLAIMVFDVERIQAQVGTAGVNEMFVCIASRIQQQLGVVNPVGRYWDRCFVSLVESIHSPAWLRTLGLRVASHLRKPLEVNGPGGQRFEVRADVGVGVVHLTGSDESVDDVLHDAQRLAQAARTMRSRAAIFDPASRAVVPVEDAELGPRRASQPRMLRHAR